MIILEEIMKSLLPIVSLLLFAACASPRLNRSTASAEKPVAEKETPAKIENHPLDFAGIPQNVEPEKALGWLKNGNTRFVKAWYRKDGKTFADRSKLIEHQKPHTIVLSCSDSRVPPEHVFDQTLGEIFTVRVAGEALDSSVIASIEYAALHLGSRLILVMGHTQCGAVEATIASKRAPAGSPSLNNLIADISPRVAYSTPETKSSGLYKESFDNAKGVASDLLTRSEIIKSLVTQGRVKVVSAIYNLNSSKVDFE